MLEYKVEDKTYRLSYQELRERYLVMVEMTDEEFKDALPNAIHLACIICFLKETPTYVCLRDDGIIHQLAHLIDIPDSTAPEFQEIRQLFKDQLALA